MGEPETFDERWSNPETFSVDSLMRADWAARKMMQAKAEMAAVAKEYNTAIKEWTEAREAAVRKAKRDAEFMEYHLLSFLARKVEEDPDGDPTVAITINLPCGAELAYRPNPGGVRRLVVEEPEEVIKWCEENLPDAIEYKLINAKVKEALTNEAPIPGARLVDPESDPFRVTLPKKEQS